MCVSVSIYGDKEYIVNTNKNIEKKMEYYAKNYDELCQLKTNSNIKILNVFTLDWNKIIEYSNLH